MPESLHEAERSRLANWVRRWRHNLRVEADLLRWQLTGRKGRIAWPGMGEPFNGQCARMAAIRSITSSFDPEIFLETGTFFGHTTELLAERGKPVHTAELKRTFALVARRRLRHHTNVQVHRKPSLDVIRRLPRGWRLFAYLDAHWWSDDPPLPHEVAALTEGWPDLTIVIDDFRVPGDPGYIYDTWGGRDLDEKLLNLPSAVKVAYPGVPSSEESGAVHGCVYLFQGERAKLALETGRDAGFLR